MKRNKRIKIETTKLECPVLQFLAPSVVHQAGRCTKDFTGHNNKAQQRSANKNSLKLEFQS